MTRSASRPWFVALCALAFGCLVAVNSLNAFDWDATVFVGFGQDATATTEYAEERLGTLELRRAQGHDGKFFFVQANDPWLLAPATNAAIIEPPVYRSQRMLYPALAGMGGLLGSEAIVWGLLIVNLFGLALGSWATARLAILIGGSGWWGMAFAANVGLIFDLQNDGAGIVAAGLALVGVLLLYEERHLIAVVPLAGAVLAREVMLVTVVGLALWHWSEGRPRIGLITAGVPCVSLGLWYLYLLARLGPDESSVQAFSAPLVGLIRAVPEWASDVVALTAGLAIIVLLVLFAHRWWESRTALGWGFIGFVPLALVLSDRVWGQVFDFTRALAPVLTAALLLIFVEYPNQKLPDQEQSTADVAL